MVPPFGTPMAKALVHFSDGRKQALLRDLGSGVSRSTLSCSLAKRWTRSWATVWRRREGSSRRPVGILRVLKFPGRLSLEGRVRFINGVSSGSRNRRWILAFQPGPRCTFSRTHVLSEKVSRTREQKRRSFANPSVLYCSFVQPGAETRRA